MKCFKPLLFLSLIFYCINCFTQDDITLHVYITDGNRKIVDEDFELKGSFTHNIYNGKHSFNISDSLKGTIQQFTLLRDSEILVDTLCVIKQGFNLIILKINVNAHEAGGAESGLLKKSFRGRIISESGNPIDSANITIYQVRNLGIDTIINYSDADFYYPITNKYGDTIKLIISISKPNFIGIQDSLIINIRSDLKYKTYTLIEDSFSRKIEGRIISNETKKGLGEVRVKASGSVHAKFRNLTSNENDNDFDPVGYFMLKTEEKKTEIDAIELKLIHRNYITKTYNINLEETLYNNPIDIEMDKKKELNTEVNSLSFNVSFPLDLNTAFPYNSLGEMTYEINYYNRLDLSNNNKHYIGIGCNLSILSFNYNDVFITIIPTGDTIKETKYVKWLLGPSLKYWFNNPNKRWGSSYFGVDFCFNSQGFYVHPKLGTRALLSDNWAFYVELKYIYPKFKVNDYEFNMYGNSTKELIEYRYSRLLINIGFAWIFQKK